MAFAPITVAKSGFVTESPAPKRFGLFRRFVNALMISRQRQADREIARYLSSHRFTDEAEREIERRFLSAPPRF
jgi:hypothetical protein